MKNSYNHSHGLNVLGGFLFVFRGGLIGVTMVFSMRVSSFDLIGSDFLGNLVC